MRQRRFTFVAIAPWIIVASVAITSAWVFTLARSDESSTPAHDAVSHVHSLGVNSADGALLVASHRGLYRLSDTGVAERIGAGYQDIMGFTTIGRDHFLGSGHPDAAGRRAGQPTLLGLIETRDGGSSWTSLSLEGEADFHALSVVGDQVFGWDATSESLMVSTDRVSWERRSMIDLLGFVALDGGLTIVAATPGGVIRSVDGGRSWSAPAGPNLTLITADSSSGLWGATGDGEIWSAGDGRRWALAGSIDGEPDALLVAGGQLWAATTGADRVTTIQRSDNGGRSWTVAYVDDVSSAAM